jgi:hypothetical protein
MRNYKKGAAENSLVWEGLCSDATESGCLRVFQGGSTLGLSKANWLWLPRRQAAQRNLVSVSSFKRRCRRMGISRWPYRVQRMLEGRIDAQLCAVNSPKDFLESLQSVIDLQKKREKLQNLVSCGVFER